MTIILAQTAFKEYSVHILRLKLLLNEYTRVLLLALFVMLVVDQKIKMSLKAVLTNPMFYKWVLVGLYTQISYFGVKSTETLIVHATIACFNFGGMKLT